MMSFYPLEFEHWFNHIAEIEKPYSDVKGDRGGKTYYGLTEATLAGLRVFLLPDQRLSKDDAMQIYYDHWWVHYRLDQMNYIVAWLYGDALVNHNPKSAAKCIQAALGVAQDGVFGPVSLSYARMNRSKVESAKLLVRYVERRNNLYIAIVRRDNSQLKFLKGWLRRLTLLSGLVVDRIAHQQNNNTYMSKVQ